MATDYNNYSYLAKYHSHCIVFIHVPASVKVEHDQGGKCRGKQRGGQKKHCIVHHSKSKFRGKSLVRNTADIGFGERVFQDQRLPHSLTQVSGGTVHVASLYVSWREPLMKPTNANLAKSQRERERERVFLVSPFLMSACRPRHTC